MRGIVVASSDVVILDSILAKEKNAFGGDLPDDKYFEQFSSNAILRQFDMSYPELDDGNLGGGCDGGLDGMYTFIDGEYVTEDYDFDTVKRTPEIEFWTIQAKRESGFGETALDRATNTIKDILDFDKAWGDLAALYDETFAARARRFRESLTSLADRSPRVSIVFVYATKGDCDTIGAPVLNRADSLKSAVQQALRHAAVRVDFVGAKELLDLARKDQSYTIQLDFAEQFISTDEDNYLGLVRLKDFLRFISDESGGLKHYAFDANVRDFQGSTLEVNSDISESLSTAGDQLDFWWLNNGITVLGSDASSAGKRVTVHNAQIVNGLQTSYTLHQLGSASPGRFDDDARLILVKVIVSDDDAARDRIIKATNFQTSIPSASLRATDRYQRNIEDYLKQNGWFYDRRKNHYKNQGKPRGRIVSIAYLAQALMSIVHLQPDQARARPSSLIKNNDDYGRLFNERNPLDLYVFCLQIMKAVDEFLVKNSQSYPAVVRTNIRFHVAMVCAARLAGRLPYYPHDVTVMISKRCDEDEVQWASDAVLELLDGFTLKTGWAMDRACKSQDFVKFVEGKLSIPAGI